MSSSSSTTLLVSLLSILSVPQPPASLSLPLQPQTPAVLKQKTRDVILQTLSSYLSSLESPFNERYSRLKPLTPHDYPTPSQEKAFVGTAASYLTDLRRDIISSNGVDKAWWTELKVGIRKSDLSEAAGPRYEQVLLALACQTAYCNLLNILQSSSKSSSGRALNLSSEGQRGRIEGLFKDLKKALNDVHTLQADSMQKTKRTEERRETLLKIQASMTRPGVSQARTKNISSEDLMAALNARIFEWNDLVRQWFEMDGTVHSEGQNELLDPTLVEMALDEAHRKPYSMSEEKGTIKSSSTQDNNTEFDNLESSFPQITPVVSAQILSASIFLSKLVPRSAMGPMIPVEEAYSVANRVSDQTTTTSTISDPIKDTSTATTLKLGSRPEKANMFTPRTDQRSTKASYTSLQNTPATELRFLVLWGLDKTPSGGSSSESRKDDPYNHLIRHVDRTSTTISFSERCARIQNALRQK